MCSLRAGAVAAALWEEMGPEGNTPTRAAGNGRVRGLYPARKVLVPSSSYVHSYSPIPDVTYLIVTKYKLHRCVCFLTINSDTQGSLKAYGLVKFAYSSRFCKLTDLVWIYKKLLGSYAPVLIDGKSRDFLVKFKYILSKCLAGQMFFNTARYFCTCDLY